MTKDVSPGVPIKLAPLVKLPLSYTTSYINRTYHCKGLGVPFRSIEKFLQADFLPQGYNQRKNNNSYEERKIYQTFIRRQNQLDKTRAVP